MLRQIFRGIHGHGNGFRIFARKKSDQGKDKFVEEDIAYEIDYYYKQDRKLMEILKRKTRDEVKNMQDEIRAMREKIEDYTRNINEDIRFLKELEKDLPASDKKKF